MIEYDLLKLYFGRPYKVNDKITIVQPTIGQIIDYGEKEFFTMLNFLTGNPTSFRLMLWDMGIDWNTLSDFDLFRQISKGLHQDDTSILLGNLDLSTFDSYEKKKKVINDETGESEEQTELVLYSEQQDILIDETTYENMVGYIRTMFNSHPKVEKAKGRITKEIIIDEERQQLEARQSSETGRSILLPLISAAVNHPGFKYRRSELDNVLAYEFFDSISRLQIYESTTALLKGMYSGMVDVKGIDEKEFNFMREIPQK